eukprot:8650900-Lingulodinium_polyedra.AAC.1
MHGGEPGLLPNGPGGIPGHTVHLPGAGLGKRPAGMPVLRHSLPDIGVGLLVSAANPACKAPHGAQDCPP